MIELRGKHNSCKVFTDNIDNATIGQLTALLNQESIADSQIRIMPDCHSGSGCVIGTTMTLKDKVIPNLVGVDIGCFTGDTEVWCSGGFYKPIKELAERNETFMTDAWDEETYSFVSTTATAFKTRTNAELVEVTYKKETTFKSQEAETKVRCTPDHKFLTCYENSHKPHYSNDTFIWKEAKDLIHGDRLWAEDTIIIVVDVKKLEETEDVYCLNVSKYHNFSIKHGVIVHNCGMLAIKLKEKRVDLTKLDSVIREYVPSGGEVHKETKEDYTSLRVDNLRCFGKAKIRPDLAYKSVGTLGGGNHFIELDKDSNRDLWLVIHTGSRHLGIEVCNYYQDVAYTKLKDAYNNGSKREKIDKIINKLKAEGRHKEISKELEKFNKDYREEKPPVPYELSYVQGEDFEYYIHDMDIVQAHAVCNRAEIARVILKYAKLHEVERFETIHNYIDTENMILRKGSVSAQAGERLLIPINMRDGSLICIGKGNPDWNYSAPHGAGRLMSRSEAKQNITLSDFKKTMKDAGIYSTSVNQSTIDESPMAYKPMQEIIDNIQDTVEIIDVIKPIYNFKAGEE